MTYTERRKYPQYTLEIRGSWGGYYWFLISRGQVRVFGTAWTRKRAWAKADAAYQRWDQTPIV